MISRLLHFFFCKVVKMDKRETLNLSVPELILVAVGIAYTAGKKIHQIQTLAFSLLDLSLSWK